MVSIEYGLLIGKYISALKPGKERKLKKINFWCWSIIREFMHKLGV